MRFPRISRERVLAVAPVAIVIIMICVFKFLAGGGGFESISAFVAPSFLSVWLWLQWPRSRFAYVVFALAVAALFAVKVDDVIKGLLGHDRIDDSAVYFLQVASGLGLSTAICILVRLVTPLRLVDWRSEKTQVDPSGKANILDLMVAGFAVAIVLSASQYFIHHYSDVWGRDGVFHLLSTSSVTLLTIAVIGPTARMDWRSYVVAWIVGFVPIALIVGHFIGVRVWLPEAWVERIWQDEYRATYRFHDVFSVGSFMASMVFLYVTFLRLVGVKSAAAGAATSFVRTRSFRVLTTCVMVAAGSGAAIWNAEALYGVSEARMFRPNPFGTSLTATTPQRPDTFLVELRGWPLAYQATQDSARLNLLFFSSGSQAESCWERPEYRALNWVLAFTLAVLCCGVVPQPLLRKLCQRPGTVPTQNADVERSIRRSWLRRVTIAGIVAVGLLILFIGRGLFVDWRYGSDEQILAQVHRRIAETAAPRATPQASIGAEEELMVAGQNHDSWDKLWLHPLDHWSLRLNGFLGLSAKGDYLPVARQLRLRAVGQEEVDQLRGLQFLAGLQLEEPVLNRNAMQTLAAMPCLRELQIRDGMFESSPWPYFKRLKRLDISEPVGQYWASDATDELVLTGFDHLDFLALSVPGHSCVIRNCRALENILLEIEEGCKELRVEACVSLNTFTALGDVLKIETAAINDAPDLRDVAFLSKSWADGAPDFILDLGNHPIHTSLAFSKVNLKSIHRGPSLANLGISYSGSESAKASMLQLLDAIPQDSGRPEVSSYFLSHVEIESEAWSRLLQSKDLRRLDSRHMIGDTIPTSEKVGGIQRLDLGDYAIAEADFMRLSAYAPKLERLHVNGQKIKRLSLRDWDHIGEFSMVTPSREDVDELDYVELLKLLMETKNPDLVLANAELDLDSLQHLLDRKMDDRILVNSLGPKERWPQIRFPIAEETFIEEASGSWDELANVQFRLKATAEAPRIFAVMHGELSADALAKLLQDWSHEQGAISFVNRSVYSLRTDSIDLVDEFRPTGGVALFGFELSAKHILALETHSQVGYLHLFDCKLGDEAVESLRGWTGHLDVTDCEMDLEKFWQVRDKDDTEIYERSLVF